MVVHRSLGTYGSMLQESLASKPERSKAVIQNMTRIDMAHLSFNFVGVLDRDLRSSVQRMSLTNDGTLGPIRSMGSILWYSSIPYFFNTFRTSWFACLHKPIYSLSPERMNPPHNPVNPNHLEHTSQSGQRWLAWVGLYQFGMFAPMQNIATDIMHHSRLHNMHPAGGYKVEE